MFLKILRRLKPQGYEMQNGVTSTATFRIKKYYHLDGENRFLRNAGTFLPDYNLYYNKA